MNDVYHCYGEAIDISPQARTTLAGYGDRTELFADIVFPLEANACVLSCGKRQLLIVTLDLLYAGAAVCQAIRKSAAAHGLDSASVIVAASHTHFAPATDDSKAALGLVDVTYRGWLMERLGALVDRVLSAPRHPVRVEHVRLRCDANTSRRLRWPWPTVSRRGFAAAGSIVMAPAPEAPRDSDLDLIRCRSQSDRTVAIFWKFACHPVGCPKRNSLNAEYPGAVREHLRGLIGEPLIPVLFLQGFAGDVRPMFPGVAERRRRLQRLLSGPGVGVPSFEQWQQWCQQICRVAERGWQDASWTAIVGPLRSAQIRIPTDQILTLEESAFVPPRELLLQRVVLGRQVELILGSAEFCSPWLRWGTPPLSTVHVGCVFDVLGYLPSEVQVREGGYEATGFLREFGYKGAWIPGFEARIDAAMGRLQAEKE